jgi:hypothetical protein
MLVGSQDASEQDNRRPTQGTVETSTAVILIQFSTLVWTILHVNILHNQQIQNSEC